MATETVPRLTPEQYLEQERRADFKSEYVSGDILARTGASKEHNLVTVNLVREFSTQLRGGPCLTFANDMRVQSTQTAYTYPDVAVVCGEAQFLDNQLDTLQNPTLIVEVLSPSTEGPKSTRERGEKFGLYRRLPSLTDYVLVSQTAPRLEHYRRQDNGQWLLTVAEGLEATLALESIRCVLPLAAVYENVPFAPERTGAI